MTMKHWEPNRGSNEFCYELSIQSKLVEEQKKAVANCLFEILDYQSSENMDKSDFVDVLIDILAYWNTIRLRSWKPVTDSDVLVDWVSLDWRVSDIQEIIKLSGVLEKKWVLFTLNKINL